MTVHSRSRWPVVILIATLVGSIASEAQDFSTPGANTVGLVWDDNTGLWWASDQDEDKIFRKPHGADTWEEVTIWGASTVTSGDPGPLAIGDSHLWVVNESVGMIASFDLTDDPPSFDGRIEIPNEVLREVPAITGLTWDGSSLWLATGCGLCSTFVNFRLDGRVIQSFFPVCEPRGLAFNPARPPRIGTLWTVAYNGPSQPAVLSARTIGNDPATVSSSQEFKTFGHGTQPPRDPTAIALRRGGIYVVDRASRTVLRIDPGSTP